MLAIGIAIAALMIGAATAAGQAAPSAGPETGSGSSGSTGVAVSGTAVVAPGVVSTGIAQPAWCCGTMGTPGVTTVGQAKVGGQGTTARDAAIAKAVQDATDQAQTAAAAAGIKLGAIVELQVSAMPIAYPMMGTAAGSSPGAPATGALQPIPYQSFVSVTITWSIG
jgi:hypothetical protein